MDSTGRSRGLAARGKSPASHRDRRGARLTRREEGEYREYSTDEQRSQPGCIAGRMQRDSCHGLPGFTLLEVMVALAIVALGMMAVHTQLNRYAVGAAIIENKVLASWIASNRIAELSVAPQWPPLGQTRDEVDYAQRIWTWRTQVSETPVENLRRVDVSVALADQPEQVLHTVTGLLEPPPPPGIPPPIWQTGAYGTGQ